MEQIVISWRAKETLNDLLSKQAKADKGLDAIKELVDIPCNDINVLATQPIKACCSQKIAEVERATFVTTETKTSLINDWNGKEKTAIKAVEGIQEFVEA